MVTIARRKFRTLRETDVVRGWETCWSRLDWIEVERKFARMVWDWSFLGEDGLR